VAHYIIQSCLDEQAAEGAGGEPVAESEPSGASAQTAGGDMACGSVLGGGNDDNATAETSSPQQKRAI
jgi:hypothetical protein